MRIRNPADSECLRGGEGGGWIVLCRPYSAGVLHSVSDQMQNLPNYFTAPNKMTSEFLRSCMGPCFEVDLTSPYVDSNTFTMGNLMPESTLTLCQSRLYSPVRDFGFGLRALPIINNYRKKSFLSDLKFPFWQTLDIRLIFYFTPNFRIRTIVQLIISPLTLYTSIIFHNRLICFKERRHFDTEPRFLQTCLRRCCC